MRIDQFGDDEDSTIPSTQYTMTKELVDISLFGGAPPKVKPPRIKNPLDFIRSSLHENTAEITTIGPIRSPHVQTCVPQKKSNIQSEGTKTFCQLKNRKKRSQQYQQLMFGPYVCHGL